MKFTIRIDELPNLQADVMQWRQRTAYRAKWRKLVKQSLMTRRIRYPKTPYTFAQIDCFRFSSGEPDMDNLRNSFKPLIDTLVQTGALEDDTPYNIGEPGMHWNRVGKGKGWVEIVFKSLNESPKHSLEFRVIELERQVTQLIIRFCGGIPDGESAEEDKEAKAV